MGEVGRRNDGKVIMLELQTGLIEAGCMMSRSDPISRGIRDEVGKQEPSWIWRRIRRVGREYVVGGVEDVFEMAGKSALIPCIGGSGAPSE